MTRGLPLLAKELIEQAARKRTYVVRVVYASLLFSAAFLLFYDVLQLGATSPLAALGRGRQMFEVLMKLQFAGIYLVMPAVTCGVLTQEKEQNTLPLLLLTKLGPWTILIEKLLSRVVPMCGFLLMSLPLLAYAYSLGGLTQVTLWSGVGMLLVTVLQMGALALMCSAWFRTTFGAFVGSYAACAALMLGPLLLFLAGSLFIKGISISALDQWVAARSAGSGGLLQHRDTILFPFFAPMQLFDYQWLPATGGLGMVIAGGRSATATALASLPIILSTVVCLVLARLFAVRRMFVDPRGGLQAIFQMLDGTFARWNQNRLTRGIVLIRDKSVLPDGNPVAWRETAKRSLGRPRYLVRIVVAFEAAFWTLLIMIAVFTEGQAGVYAKLLVFLVWLVAVLLVAVHAATLISGERAHQTLDVLCTTPLTGRDIVLQKYAAVRRLVAVLWMPFLTLILVELGERVSAVASFLSVAIYLPLAAWVSMWIGLKAKTRARAIVTALAAIVGWCTLPVIFIFMPLMILQGPGHTDSPLNFSIFLSPAMMIAVNEYGEWWEFGGSLWPAVVLNFLLYGSLLFFIRRACLVHADRLLGRAESCPNNQQAEPGVMPHSPAIGPW
jgi:ABC-type transport system involved in multi-copper enzyme maturation permease subunit